MKRNLVFGVIACALAGFAAGYVLRPSGAQAQRPRDEPGWEYKVGIFSYNPGERLTDEQRRALYERALNAQAREGWEVVGPVLSRDTVQTVGGAVTTRDSTSFVAYRRPRR